jgi:SM-20-related protein
MDTIFFAENDKFVKNLTFKMSTSATDICANEPNEQHSVFSAIANNLRIQGYCVLPNAVPDNITSALYDQIQHKDTVSLCLGKRRDPKRLKNLFIHRDERAWIKGKTMAEKLWLTWATSLKDFLNQQLDLSLFSYEGYFSHYSPGGFCQKHNGASNKEKSRQLSMITYLNPEWNMGYGGQLIICPQSSPDKIISVSPEISTLVVFMSEQCFHSVLPTWRDQYSIFGGYSVYAPDRDNLRLCSN